MENFKSTTSHAGLAACLILGGLIGCSSSEPETPTAESTPEEPQATDPEGQPKTSAPTEEATVRLDESPGLSVGATAPPFELKDQSGELRSLADILEAGPAALVFYRSADW